AAKSVQACLTFYSVRMVDDRTLREKAREVIQARKLPNRRPDGMWGGPGAGAECAICGEPVNHGEVEFELEFVRHGDDRRLDKYHVHIHCFGAWESERDDVELPRGDDPTGGYHHQPVTGSARAMPNRSDVRKAS